MKYIKIEQNFDGNYELRYTNAFYDIFMPLYKGHNSYWNVMFRVFGLLPRDFYHYVGAHYGASFQPHKYIRKHITMFWTDKKKAETFARELDSRIDYAVRQF